MIRSFKLSDMDSVLDIWLQASIKAHDFIGAEYWRSKVPDMRDIYIPASETYVFSSEGKIEGFFSLCGDTLAAV